MGKRSDPKIVQTLELGRYTFAWEDYWVEDDAGFCSVEFVWEKHTRLKIFDKENGELARVYDFDSRQDEKTLSIDGNSVLVTYQLNVMEKVQIRLDPENLAVVERLKTTI